MMPSYLPLLSNVFAQHEHMNMCHWLLCLHRHTELLCTPPTCSLEASAVECIRTSVPRSEAVASSLPSSDSAMHTSGELCAWMNLVRRTSYSSTRTCSMYHCCLCAAAFRGCPEEGYPAEA